MHCARILSLLALAACHVGTRVEAYPPARRPAGAAVTVKARGTAFDAELLAVSDTGFLLLHRRNGVVVFAPYANLRAVTVPEIPVELGKGERPDSSIRNHLRLLARFPQGVGPAQLRVLLNAYRQDSVDVVER